MRTQCVVLLKVALLGGRRELAFSGVMLLLACMFSGCATSSDLKNATPPPVKMGEWIDLNVSKPARWHAAIDGNGNAHVLCVTEGNRLEHLVVMREGVMSRETVLPKTGKHPLDAVIDAAGTMHVLCGDWYLRSNPSGWQKAERGRCEQLLAAGTNVLGSWPIKGSEVKAPKRLNIYGIGGYGGGIIWPWINSGQKAVIGRRAGESWNAVALVEPKTRKSIGTFQMTSADGSNVLMSYFAMGPNILGAQETSMRLGRFQLLAEIPPTPAALEGKDVGTNAPTLQVAQQAQQLAVFRSCLFTLHNDSATQVNLRDRWLWAPRFAAARTNTAHAVAWKTTSLWAWSGRPVLEYFYFVDGQWSAPVELVGPGSYSNADTGLVSSAAGGAFVLTRVRGDRLVARWIDLP